MSGKQESRRYSTGEGVGYVGGNVSSSIDGLRIAEAVVLFILQSLL